MWRKATVLPGVCDCILLVDLCLPWTGMGLTGWIVSWSLSTYLGFGCQLGVLFCACIPFSSLRWVLVCVIVLPHISC